MNISCSHKIEADEGLKVEFKSSLLFAPDNAPTYIQQEAIARTICAFINSEGGTLYLGVNDGGYPVGLSTDMKELSANPRRFTTKGAFASDEGYSYRPNIEQLYLKFKKIIEAYLGKKGLQHILDYDKKEDGSNAYLVIPVKPADKGDFVYFINHQGKAEIWIRTPGATRILTDKDRDDFIAAKAKERCSKETGNLLMSIHTRLSAMLALGKTHQDDDNSDTPQNESLDSALKSLMTEVCSVLFPQESSLEDCMEYYATFDNQTSSMAIMDEFERTVEGQKIYGRMLLTRDPALCSVPYRWEESDRCFHKLVGCDFGLSWVSLLIERCPTGNSLIDISYKDSFTFSDFKSGYMGRLHELIWDAMTDEIKTVPVGGWHTILFKQFLGFKAHNSSSQYLDIPQYRIVGVRCSKCKLRRLDAIFDPHLTWRYVDVGIEEKQVPYGDVSYSTIMGAYNSLCSISTSYEQLITKPDEYREAKRRNLVKMAKSKGMEAKLMEAKLDVLELPRWLSFLFELQNINTIGKLANLTDVDVLTLSAMFSKIQSSVNDIEKEDIDIQSIKEARQKAKDFLHQAGITRN